VMWLTGRLIPDHKTIADFRKDNGPAIKKVCAQFVALCRKMGLLAKASVAIDGSKFKAVNSRDNNFTKGKMDRRLAQIEESVARLVLAAEKLGLKERLAENSRWDQAAVALEFSDILKVDSAIDLEISGFKKGEIDVLLGGNGGDEEDEWPAVDDTSLCLSQRGDLWLREDDPRQKCRGAPCRSGR
jgi:hypothetical protein